MDCVPVDKYFEAIPNMHGIPRIPVRALNRFKKYLEKTWIVGKLDALSVFKQESRTNNHSEVYNKKWNSRVQVHITKRNYEGNAHLT